MATRKFFELTTENPSQCNLTEFGGATGYDKGWVNHNDIVAHVNRYGFVLKHLTTGRCKDSSSILDVGCGHLQLPFFLWRNRCPSAGRSYWGFELNMRSKWVPSEDEHWQVPMSLARLDILDSDPSQCEGWPGQFDVVVNFEVFEHVPVARQQHLVNRLFSWTKPGGYCFFSTPNAGVSDSTAENHIDPVTGESRERTYGDKMEIVRQAGFEVLETYGTFCGVTRLPDEVRERFKTDPILAKAKEFLLHSQFTTMVSCAYPEQSNNALFFMRRPA